MDDIRHTTRVVPINIENLRVHDLHTASPARAALWFSKTKLRVLGAVVIAASLVGIGFWRSSLGTLPMTEPQISAKLGSAVPQDQERALTAIGERIRLNRPAVHWYPTVVRLSASADEQVRARAAWVMGLDAKGTGFHQSLTAMLNDPARDVQGVAGVSLAAFGDRAGHAQVVEMLRPLTLSAPHSGEVINIRRREDVKVGGMVVTLRNGESTWEVKSPIAGVIGKLFIGGGDAVSAGVPVATVYPSPEHAWDALHALESIGELPDLEVVTVYQGDTASMPQNVIDEASAAERAIRRRSDSK